ncbi:hypothetical protein EV702DRAFT_1279835, partial [Suillus placidus]
AEQPVFPSDETLGLRPTTGEIFCKCPQFRILVIGKTGVGKSSLIKHTFGVQNATASHEKPSEASIDHDHLTAERQLHAIWWGLRLSGRLLETGVEQFFTSKREGELGNIPIVVVFTKYDTLLDRVERTLDKSSIKGVSKAAIKELTKNSAKDKLQEVCIAPLEKFAGSGIPHVTVSTNGNHKETLVRLIQTTRL